MDPRDDHTSTIRSRLLNVLHERMPRSDPQSPPDAPPALPPPQQQHPLPAPPVAQTGELFQQPPHLPSLSLDNSSSEAHSLLRPVDSTFGRTLTPITELNSARETLADWRGPGPSLLTDQSHGPQQHTSGSDEDEPLSNFVAASVIFENGEDGLVLGRSAVSSPAPTSGASRKLSGDSFGKGPSSRPDSKLSPSTENVATKSQETYVSNGGIAEVMGVKLPFSPLTSPESPSFSTNSSLSVRSPTPGTQGPTLQSPGSPGSVGKSPRSPPSSPSYSILTSPHSLLEKDLPSIQALQTIQTFPSPPPRSLMRNTSSRVPPVPDKPTSPSPPSLFSTPASKLTLAPPPADPQSVFTDALFFMQQLDDNSAPPRRVPTTISEKSDTTSVSEPGLPAHVPLSGAASPSQPVRGEVVLEPSLSSSRIALGRKPSGARALTGSGASRMLNPDASVSSPEQHHLHRVPDSDTDTMSDHGASPAAKKAQVDDVNADALAALSFLDADSAAAPAPPKPPTPSTSAEDAVRPRPPRPPQPTENPPATESPDNVGQYKSTFAPSKQAVQRKARLQAQQAAHQAAVHRPGRANGKRGSGPRVSGWNETSDEDEEEEEEEEEEEDADSDNEPSTTGSKRPSQTSVHAPSPALAPIGGQPIRPLRPQSRTQSPAEVATATDANPFAQLRHPRGLPPVPRPQTQGNFGFRCVVLS